jgi:ABC-type antimicrobial peptide transport system permease subunit
MLRNNILLAIRNISRNRTFSGINILGLSLGLSVFILIMLWVKNEYSYDGFHRDKDRIAAVLNNQTFENGETATFPAVPSLLAAAIQKDLPAVESAATSSWGDNRQLNYGEKKFIEYGLYVSPEFLKIFTFPLLKGNPDEVLKEPHTILLTETLAAKYFGNEEPVGKTILVEEGIPYKVTGILKDIPDNATLSFGFLMPVRDYIEFTMGGSENWEINNMRAYVKLKAGINREQFDKEFEGILLKYTDKQPRSKLMLWNLSDWYLHFDFRDGKYAGGGRIAYVRLFTAIGIFILLLACINFMNLSTARAAHRAREVGVRKAVGAVKLTLVKQFIVESLLMSTLAGLIAIAGVTLVLPHFNMYFHKHIILDITDTRNILAFTAILAMTGLLAGTYPAWVLSAHRPAQVLKNIFTPSSAHAVWIRRGLVIFQFTVSILLITGTIVVSQQVDFIKNRDLGYKKEHLIWFTNNIPAEKGETAIREFLKVPGVKNVSQASLTFTMSNNRGSQVTWPGKKPGQEIFFSFIASGYDIVETMGLTVKEGRGFSRAYPADTGAILVNEEAVRRMGISNPVGQTIDLYSGKGTIAGVVKDFHLESLHHPIAPVIIMCKPEWTWNMYVRTDGRDIQQTIKGIETVYKTLAPGFVLDYNFQDKEYDSLYRSESQIGLLVRWFAGLAVTISCLGLLGLALYTVEKRTREIGIRKVLGAPVSSIVSMISGQFFWLILLSTFLAILPAFVLMHNWLEGYAYRVSIRWWVYAVAGGLAICVALATVGIQALRAAMANPVRSLRTE